MQTAVKPDLLVLNNGVQTKTKCEKYKGFEGCKTKLEKQSESYVLFNHGVSGLKEGCLKIPNDVINFRADPRSKRQVFEALCWPWNRFE